ncbi:hypothetical protein [Kurthia huakuii]|uniref:hypothetical protein n=1 Tax=Kurthia huakuii TaxID=1421019 RepID=UPI00049758E9|nr:hypothetical protein [Kurthia huakuii]MBM7698573.1 hypothetical protein [Kurthia huakuii]
MAIGYFFLGDTGLHVAQHVTHQLDNMQFVSLHKTTYIEDGYRKLLALDERKTADNLTQPYEHHYHNIPDYIECLRGKLLFCSVPDTQFGSFDTSHCEERIAAYADLLTRMMAPYEQVVFVMRPGQASGELCVECCVNLAQQLQKGVQLVTTRGLAFEQKMKDAADVHLRKLKRLRVPITVVEVPIHRPRILDTYDDLYRAMARKVEDLQYEMA